MPSIRFSALTASVPADITFGMGCLFLRCIVIISAWLFLHSPLFAADTFRVACYNVENYLDEKTGTRPLKTDAAKAKIRESICALKPDVIALEEMGSTNALLELQGSLKSEGLDLPYWEHVAGFDTNIHVAVLSKFPFTAHHPHTNDAFLLNGRRFQVSRGFAEVDIQPTTNYSFTLIAAHLKSRRQIAAADESELRLEEAKVLREIIDARLAANPNLNLIVLGDFNDLHDSAPIKTILGGRSKKGLIDTRPAERNGDDHSHTDRRVASRNITWTHFYAKEDTYSRVDYILLSHGIAREWNTNESYVLSIPNWGTGSDHRPLVASFTAQDK
ncbi:endonuclease/exonuclease/phosphatase family protein [Pedosphaera parvula]|uniref:Endonuclease/exonuclease/phosphatase n=1 Tax=Pedosphaera parvula (strain Ellin514) TaxID=320771 RepID=B9XP51_PEDPL|nr:endonuclease/exonuclease/phosphatase family protein [Pedosphaera parvula]EEF58407.1 Endonuclease/exonuclease/phosphatase [Pedosphaera parvula Ellin514]